VQPRQNHAASLPGSHDQHVATNSSSETITNRETSSGGTCTFFIEVGDDLVPGDLGIAYGDWCAIRTLRWLLASRCFQR
jgi:hypothetical protein